MPNPRGTRITLDLDDADYQLLRDIEHKVAADSRAQVMRYALHLYASIIGAHSGAFKDDAARLCWVANGRAGKIEVPSWDGRGKGPWG